MLENLMGALDLVLCWENFFWVFVGVFCGAIMGAIPGLTDTMAIVLLLPFTYYLGPIPGIAMLMGLSKGGNFGGSLPAILFNIPGTPQAMCTTFDGHPLAMQGKSGKAMQTALFSSVTADALSDLVLIFLAAPVAAVALHIGPPEYSMVVLFSLVVISVAACPPPWGCCWPLSALTRNTVPCVSPSGSSNFLTASASCPWSSACWPFPKCCCRRKIISGSGSTGRGRCSRCPSAPILTTTA